MMIVAMLLALVLPTTSFSLTRAPAPRSIVARRATPAAVVMFADEDEPLLNSTSALRLLDQQLRSMRSHSAFFDEIFDEETDTLNLLAERSALFNDAHENDLKLKESDSSPSTRCSGRRRRARSGASPPDRRKRPPPS